MMKEYMYVRNIFLSKIFEHYLFFYMVSKAPNSHKISIPPSQMSSKIQPISSSESPLLFSTSQLRSMINSHPSCSHKGELNLNLSSLIMTSWTMPMVSPAPLSMTILCQSLEKNSLSQA